MEYIIDGYNLIKGSFLKKFETCSIEAGREALLEVLSGYRRKHPGVKFTVVFDGFPVNALKYLTGREIKVRFSGQISADEVIRKMLETRGEKNRYVTVVSNDREVQVCTRINGGNVSAVEEFLNVVSPSVKKSPPKKEGSNKQVLGYKKVIQIEKELKNFYEKKDKYEKN
jgi:predicted RNA-binding protein with PIN domain